METEHGAADAAPLDDLVALAIERLHEGGKAALEAVLRAHPEDAPSIRRRLQLIDDAGMLAPGTAAAAGDAIPERLGEYRLGERLGSGGMGVVFAAEQPSLSRQVALKLIRPEHLYFPTARERFRREVEAVAQLQHPGIVRVYAVGEENGLPYFTMERVEGVSLDRLLAALRSTTPADLDENDVRAALAALGGGERLAVPESHPRSWVETACRWMRELADAVEYAHGRDVLHRDIKPSNIMITWSMRAVLLDFGLARTADSAAITRSGVELGSLPYMAPEQVRGDTARIGVRTDVYALGVLLYEMLTLRNPFQDGSTSEEETRQRIVAAEPPPVKLSNGAVSWDAETVCRCAMAPEPEQRYQDAASLGRDLQNLLDLRPIAARRPGASVRLRRYVRRHPARAVAMVMGVLLVLAAPTVFAVAERWLREDIARANATQADILRFFNDELLAAVSPEGVGKDATMREVLDVAAAKLDGRFPDRPLVEAAIRTTLGRTYYDLGVLDAAEHHLSLSQQLFLEHAGSSDRTALSVERQLGMVYSAQQRYAELEDLERKNLEMCRSRFGEEDRDTLAAANNLGLLLTRRGKHTEAERLLLHVVETRLRLLGEADDSTQVSMSNLGVVYYNLGRYADAERWVKRELDLCRAGKGDDHPATLISRHNHANLLAVMGRNAEAVEAMDQVVTASRRVRGDQHAETLAAMASLARQLTLAGRPGEALPWWDEMLRCASGLAPDHPRVLAALVHRADTLREAGRLADAAAAIEAAYGRCRDALGEADQLTRSAELGRARVWLEQGRRQDAASVFGRVLAEWSDDPTGQLARLRLIHARNLRALGRLAEAEEQLLDGQRFLAASAPEYPIHGEVLAELAEVCEATGRAAAAATWRARLHDWQTAATER